MDLDFTLRINLIKATVVWIWLPHLHLGYWHYESILKLAGVTDRPISLDGFTDLVQKSGFARVKLKINASQPLNPMVGICLREYLLLLLPLWLDWSCRRLLLLFLAVGGIRDGVDLVAKEILQPSRGYF